MPGVLVAVLLLLQQSLLLSALSPNNVTMVFCSQWQFGHISPMLPTGGNPLPPAPTSHQLPSSLQLLKRLFVATRFTCAYPGASTTARLQRCSACIAERPSPWLSFLPLDARAGTAARWCSSLRAAPAHRPRPRRRFEASCRSQAAGAAVLALQASVDQAHAAADTGLWWLLSTRSCRMEATRRRRSLPSSSALGRPL